MSEVINTFDIDGVIFMGEDYTGIFPGPYDIIITGRSIEESKATLDMLHERGIFNQVYFNPIPFAEKTRGSSGQWKGKVLKMLMKSGIKHGVHYEDDEVQIEEIHDYLNGGTGFHMNHVNIVHVKHTLVPKENVWHKPK